MSVSTLRKDAERNRERILEAARAVFAERGLDAGLHDVAERAGVGVGTVYRRFPDKEQLVDALFEDRIDEVVALAERANDHEDAFAGLAFFLESTLLLQCQDRGLHERVFSDKGSDRAQRARKRIAPRVMKLVQRAQAEGTMRPDVTGYDVAMLRNMLGSLVAAGGANLESVKRYLTLVLDGLRAERSGPTALPGKAASAGQFERALSGR